MISQEFKLLKENPYQLDIEHGSLVIEDINTINMLVSEYANEIVTPKDSKSIRPMLNRSNSLKRTNSAVATSNIYNR